MSHTERTLTHCVKQGWCADKSEYWNAFARKRKDLFGFVDIVAIAEGKIIALQVTSKGHISHRVKKITTECAEVAQTWLAAGGLIQVWGWAKRQNRWQPTIRNVDASSFMS